MIVYLERLWPPSFLVLLLFFTQGPRFLHQVLVSKSPVVPIIFFLGHGHLISTGHLSSFAPTFYHEHAILSCPRPGSLMPAFPQGSLLGVSKSSAILAWLLPASLLGFLGCHLLLKSLAYASLCISFLSKAQNLFSSLYVQAPPFFISKGQTFLPFSLSSWTGPLPFLRVWLLITF